MKSITTQVNFQFSSSNDFQKLGSLHGFWQNRIEIHSKIDACNNKGFIFVLIQIKTIPGLNSCIRHFSYFIIYLLYEGPILILNK
ncbi:unnamed protein product [Paramecium pentaurelia]|uniref:Uncharacterized protein n=1 Tax=Paramecium pentaurelia TaxID=43138 RepID=A0A8S1X129_9CILI|nr:unnamed protein product [Paramecium pentaurelia]